MNTYLCVLYFTTDVSRARVCVCTECIFFHNGLSKAFHYMLCVCKLVCNDKALDKCENFSFSILLLYNVTF